MKYICSIKKTPCIQDTYDEYEGGETEEDNTEKDVSDLVTNNQETYSFITKIMVEKSGYSFVVHNQIKIQY